MQDEVPDGRPVRGGQRDLEEGDHRHVPRDLRVGPVEDARLGARVEDPAGLI